jgi:putative transposase
MFYHGCRIFSDSFRLVRQAFLQAEGLPFSDILSEEEVEAAFDAENADFARDEGDIYTPAITLWALLSQALNPGRLRSCAAAVSRITVLCVALGRKPPSPDTGAYCRARSKLPERVLQRLVYGVADQLESRVPADWLWLGRHVKAGDGTTLTAPDTEENQRAWPQSRTQKPGLGFPILRMVVLFSLATAAVSGLAVGPCKGKQTGESALFRTLLDRLQPGDVFLGDCGFCSYAILALLLLRRVDVVVRQHQRRHTDFRLGRRLGKEDHVVQWRRPARPAWMDEETYAAIPATLSVRELRVHVAIRGFRVRQLIVVTTLTDADRYPKEEIAALFRQRWHAELDLRNIKISLQMDDLRGKTPEMVRREIWAHWLAYNLIRKTMAQAALAHGKLPRQVSFANALAAVAASWDHATVASRDVLVALAKAQFRVVASHQVGNRPDRVEPRAVKRRPKPHPLLKEPRALARAHAGRRAEKHLNPFHR